LKGHDFSRAANSRKKAGLQPLKEGFWQFDTNLEPFENDHICGGLH
jgi:hypothetical protein